MPHDSSIISRLNHIEHGERRKRPRGGILGQLEKFKNAVTKDSPAMERLKKANESICITAEEAAGIVNNEGHEDGE